MRHRRCHARRRRPFAAPTTPYSVARYSSRDNLAAKIMSGEEAINLPPKRKGGVSLFRLSLFFPFSFPFFFFLFSFQATIAHAFDPRVWIQRETAHSLFRHHEINANN